MLENTIRRSALACASACALAAVAPALQEGDELGDVPNQDLRAGGDEHMRYFLIGGGEGLDAPKDGFKLLLVLPGGDGSDGFNPFVRRIHREALGADYLVAQLVAPKWDEEQVIVWPTEKNPHLGMRFDTETFVDAVIEDVEARHALDGAHVFTLSWSSGGPAAYAYALRDDTRATGSFVAMSVFKPDLLPSLSNARGRAFFLYHSPEDDVCPFRMAEEAVEKLAKKKAEVELVTYEGGHGWRGNVYGDLRRGIEWLERHHGKAPKPKRK